MVDWTEMLGDNPTPTYFEAWEMYLDDLMDRGALLDEENQRGHGMRHGEKHSKKLVKHMKCDSDMEWHIVEGTVSMVMKVEGVEEEIEAVVEAGAGEGAVGLGMDIQATMDMEPIQNRYAS